LESDTVRGFEHLVSELRGHRDYLTDKARDHEARIARLESLIPPHP
jgi:hypothetical protein